MSQSVPVPLKNWLSVWNDGDRFRLGYDDGTLYSLPSLVPLSNPSPTPVSSYATFCRIVYAATADGLVRLDSDAGGGSAGWIAVSLPSPLDGPGALTGGRLYSTGNELDVFAGGKAVKLVAANCPP